MATESNTGDKNEPKWPELERRRERPAEAPGFAPEVQLLVRPRKVPAIYLIEREAIRLRRRRWEELKAHTPEARRLAPDPLGDYARPADSKEPPTFTRRMGLSVRAFFSGLFKG
jgi:hypothetical protein